MWCLARRPSLQAMVNGTRVLRPALVLLTSVCAGLLFPLAGGAGRVADTSPAPSARPTALDPNTLPQARRIRSQVSARYRRAGARALVVTEASATGVLESFTLLTSALEAPRIVPAENGVYFALCPSGASCPYPARRFARPATDFLPRRQALELALRTFLETSSELVVVSLPTARFVLLVLERAELERVVDLRSLAGQLDGDPAQAPSASLRSVVDRITRPLLFLPFGIERTASGRDSLVAVPLRT